MRVRAVRVIVAAILLVAGAVGLPGWQWPVRDPVIARTFGQDAGGYLFRGIELTGGAQPVFPVEAGVVVVSHRARDGVPSGLGSFVVVEHDQAFRSIYAHLEAGILPDVGQHVDVDAQIGTVGESGLVPGRALRLYLIDLETGSYVNPLLLLPDIADTVAPAVEAVYARDAESLYDLGQASTLPPGSYEITASIADRVSADRGGEAVAPYAIRMFVGGEETFAVVMDRIVVDPQTTQIEPGRVSAERLYGVPGLVHLGTLTVSARRTDIEIVTLDFAGNESSWSHTISGSTTPDEDVQ